MKRLFRIGTSIFLQSLIPILYWFALSLTIDKNLFNIFSITYPFQFIVALIVHIFGTGANIKKEKDHNDNSVFSGIILGTIISFLIFIPLCIFADKYLIFMNMEVETYLSFVRFSFLQLMISTIFQLLLEKLYYENKDKKAVYNSVAYNLINLISLLGFILITKNQIVVIFITISLLALYIIILFTTQIKKFKMEFNILHNLKYELQDIASSTLMFIGFLFGFSSIFNFGIEYVVALNFVTIICDVQWDACDAMSKCSQIDIVHNNFKLKKHLKNGVIYVLILILTSILSFALLYKMYNVSLLIGIYFMIFQMTDFILSIPMYILSPFIQLQFSATKNTIKEIISYVIRTLLSVFLPTIFCCDIGQVTSSIICLIFYAYVLIRYFKLNEQGLLEKKTQNPIPNKGAKTKA